LKYPDCGYVQGMGFVSAVLMTYTTPEDSFCIMNALFTLEKYKMHDLFLPGMPGLERSFYVFLSLQKQYLPKVFHRLNELGFVPQMYASQWFLTMFAIYFPIDIVVNLWDIMLVEGRKTIFRVALAILKLNEE
jgi:hypothetical protein